MILLAAATSRRTIHSICTSHSRHQDIAHRWLASKVSALSLNAKKRKGKKISMVTAYDYPSAVHVARAGIDVVLVGDSVAMVELGHETTQHVTLDAMIHHCESVKRGLEFAGSGSMLIGDMPFGSYEFDDTDVALRNAYRFVKEGGCDAIKLEGGSESRAKTARKIVDGGVAVLGHVGLTPQAISVIGGFRAQGRTAVKARQVLDDALRLQDAGCFAVVLECVPANVATAITETLEIPTIGIGAGGGTSGQVLVFHDMLGMLSHPHHEQFVPKFCKKYAQVGHAIQDGLSQFKAEVESGVFPGEEYSPYVMTEGEKEAFDVLLQKDAKERQRKHDLAAEKLSQADEYETLKLYGADGGSDDKGR
ncbi:ketopantoate hydroxymethyltransferase-domain containing protein [Nitzschia inconspicua]|uniref:3-methyl-2-oxobutanoate hydroxymethyltransferase n=1 Tax=Nitzschia inconspicua TaxID=303405 RepID=A0A9K3LDU6_9STRA|nr:ketopantoate hydroxymethyltransferase-domain containing protein [Nitzschia inconspicua]